MNRVDRCAKPLPGEARVGEEICALLGRRATSSPFNWPDF